MEISVLGVSRSIGIFTGLCQGSKQYHGASQIIYLKYINFSFKV